MKMSFTKKIAIGLAATLVSATAAIAEYPERQIDLIVPFGAGGGSDRVARIVDGGWTSETGTGWNFQYKPGAGGAVGSDAIARARNDGYTVGIVNLPNLAIQPISGAASFKLEDFTYLGRVNVDPIAIVVPNDSPYQTLADFTAAAKENPKVLTLAITGTLGTAHIAALEIMRGSETEVTLVPTQGGANTVARVAGGHVSAGIIGAGLASRQETLRTLAISGGKRSEAMPDVPSFSESGYNVNSLTSRIFVGPKDMPEEAVSFLRQKLGAVAQNADIQAEFLKSGQIPVWQSGADLEAEVLAMGDEIRALLVEFGVLK